MLSPLLTLPGAVPVPDGPDAGVAWHYGDPLREQRRLSAGQGYVDVSHRGVVRVAGPDRAPWLHSLTTQHLSGLTPGQPTEALVLDPHGHVEHHMRLVDDGTAVWMTVEPGTAPALVAYLESMRFWSQVDVADVSDDYAVVWTPWPGPDVDVLGWSAPPPSPLPGREIILPRLQLAGFPGRPGVGPPAGMWALEALRVAAGLPRLGFDTDHRTIPHEVGWVGSAVHLDKGCYRGQETVARVQNLGRPPRRLTLLQLDGTREHLPAHGDPVRLGDRQVGFVGTASVHHELGPIALALVKRTVPTDAILDVDGVTAAQEPVPPAAAPAR
jgi:folate-binding protein YgfZ